MNRITKFFHELFNPHCEHCVEKPRCETCEELKSIITTEKYEKKQLLDVILRYHSPAPQPVVPEESRNIEPIRTSPLPWKVRQEMLEQESRERKRILDERAREIPRKEVDELEKELGIDNVIS